MVVPMKTTPKTRTIALLSLAASAALAFTGCSGAPTTAPVSSPDDAAAPTAAAPSSSLPDPSIAPSPTAEPELAVNDRGNLPAKVGQKYGVYDPAGTLVVEFTVHKFTLDGGLCNSGYSEKPANGHFLVADVSVKTLPAMRGFLEESGYDEFLLAGSWTAYSNSGQQLNGGPEGGSAMWCLDEKDSLPYSLKAGRSARGLVAFDVADKSGYLGFEDPYSTGANLEWRYGK